MADYLDDFFLYNSRSCGSSSELSSPSLLVPSHSHGAQARFCSHFGLFLLSPEERTTRLSNAACPFRAGNGRTSPNQRGRHPSNPNVSISDVDVRALKILYNPVGVSGSSSSSGPGTGSSGRPGSPSSPTENNEHYNAGRSSVEAFTQRVQALISDDRALMEHLIRRFAQVHALLKKNAERGQKPAQESRAALETYQRQVRALEEQLAQTDILYVYHIAFFYSLTRLIEVPHLFGREEQMQ